MQTITVYGTAYCPYCVAAKEFLTAKGVSFAEVDLTNDTAKREELSMQHDYHTVPMIFIGDELIGGYSDLVALDQAGKLDAVLSSQVDHSAI